MQDLFIQLSSLVRNVPFLTSIEMSLFLADAVGCSALTILPYQRQLLWLLGRREAPAAGRRAKPARGLGLLPGERGFVAVGKWETCFWFSTFPSACFPPELWKCGNLALFARFPRNGGKRGNPAFGFPRFPPFRHFHSSLFHYAVLLFGWICR